MKHVEIYTDGACSGNPGPGGWCAILMFGGKEKIISDAHADTTNNRMEVLAAISGLEALNQPCEVDLYSDSAYLVNAVTLGWLDGWKSNGWKSADKKPVKNIDLWQRLDALLAVHSVRFIKVKGHSDNENNNRCDKYAREAIARLTGDKN